MMDTTETMQEADEPRYVRAKDELGRVIQEYDTVEKRTRVMTYDPFTGRRVKTETYDAEGELVRTQGPRKPRAEDDLDAPVMGYHEVTHTTEKRSRSGILREEIFHTIGNHIVGWKVYNRVGNLVAEYGLMGKKIWPVSKRHGHAKRGGKTADYTRWRDMMRKCYSPSHKQYQTHGARGIRVAEVWHSFARWYQDIGCGYTPEKPCLLRIVAKGDFTPDNCQWAPAHQQTRNAQMITTPNGYRMPLTDWCRANKRNPVTIRRRLAAGMTLAEAIETPKYCTGRRRRRKAI